MYISVNSNNEIKKVGIDENLTVLWVDETDADFPFRGWSDAKICCYKVNVVDGRITMMTPYIWSNNLEVIDMLGKAGESNAEDIIVEQNRTTDIEDMILEMSEIIYG